MISFRTRLYFVATTLWMTAGLAVALEPRRYAQPLPARLEDLVPRSFGDWHEVEDGPVAIDPSVVDDGEKRNMSHPYDDVLMRSYADSSGQLVQLAFAYSRVQSQEIKIHRPDRCYFAQGFTIASVKLTPLPALTIGGRAADGGQMLAEQPGRTEAVTFLMRIGKVYTSNPWKVRYRVFADGLIGNVDDGVLIRASQIIHTGSNELVESYDRQSGFLTELINALPETTRQRLIP